ncbi:peptidoglycan editing factor PgeF [Lachnospiraceae bacterium 62-35]
MDYKYNWKRKDKQEILEEKESGGVTYLSFPALEASGMVIHAFSTRMGGVSEGAWSSMNLSFTRGDKEEHVRENYSRIAKALGIQKENMVLAWQTHTTNIRIVSKDDAGKGVVKERDYRDVDGLITDVPGLVLVTFFADCVPLYFLDPVHRAIGLSHSGWRGTVKRMGKVTLDKMKEAYGSRPEDMIACIGPSICKDCFEVGEEVIEEFREAFLPKWEADLFHPNGKPGKYQLDLWRANEIILTEAGIRQENIHTTNICTCCNPQLLYSHRRMGEQRGNLCGFLGLI